MSHSTSKIPRKLTSRTKDVVVARASEIFPGEMRTVDVDGRGYLIVNLDGTFHALSNTCPHERAPLGAGQLTGAMLPCAPGEFKYGLEGQLIECPWHRWKFDVTTGESPFGTDRRKVPSFPVRIDGDDVLLTVPDRSRRAAV
ncbi:Rieske (2Fe-2S) protein [Rhodococcus rhodochrous]|uniref:Rieske (2Fe-2S) protein n=1 Tax=Rhodococcus rhodochrous TaxID=1829 RepID=UPI0009BF923F|nr:Rieske 2Fe-2S domain-containing protein [Rhodococcus rhodochrous]